MPTKLPIQKYLQMNLFEELGLQNVTQEQRIKFLESFLDVIQKRVMIRLLSEMSESDKDELETVTTNHPDDELALGVFIQKAVPNFQQIAEEEIAAYKKQLVDRMKA
jgi:hypothetical protein